jgi:kynurenine 3-monooxygenase
LFFPLEGPDSLELVDAGGPPAILAYFQRHFPDVIPLIPDLVTDYQTSPNSALLQIKCDTYHAPGARVAILGDAAHACVPFYGQGMNAAFEDCLLLSEIMEEMDMDVSKALPEFTRRRARAGQALADLSFENYIEMRHHTASTLFLLRKRIESVFQRLSGGRWLPQYSMVAFTRTPYDEVVRRARKQDRVIETMARSIIVVAGAATVWGITALVKRNYPDALPQVNFSVTWPRWASSLTSSSNTTRATVRK